MSPKMPLQFRALVLTALLAAPVAAAPVKMLGFEDMSCRAWIASKDDADQRKLYIAWVRGVLSGHNYARQNQQVSEISSGTIENFVNRYCSEKPLGEFGDAALRMSDRFSGRNEIISK